MTEEQIGLRKWALEINAEYNHQAAVDDACERVKCVMEWITRSTDRNRDVDRAEMLDRLTAACEYIESDSLEPLKIFVCSHYTMTSERKSVSKWTMRVVVRSDITDDREITHDVLMAEDGNGVSGSGVVAEYYSNILDKVQGSTDDSTASSDSSWVVWDEWGGTGVDIAEESESPEDAYDRAMKGL